MIVIGDDVLFDSATDQMRHAGTIQAQALLLGVIHSLRNQGLPRVLPLSSETTVRSSLARLEVQT
jgi:hypothetical protein